MDMQKSQDLKIMELIEKKLGITLQQLDLEEIESFKDVKNGFSINDKREVTGLWLENLYLKSVINSISEFKDLRKLRLRSCRLEDDDISLLRDLSELMSLDLSGNKKIKGYSFLQEMKGLTALNLSRNELNDVSFIRDLKGLTVLDLGYNKLNDVSFLQDLKGLTTLVLSQNELNDVSFLRELKVLTTLDLSGNALTYVSSLPKLKRLTTLDLSENGLSDVSFLRELRGLTALDLGYNELKDISSLRDLKGLAALNLSWNGLTDISPLRDMKGLTALDLSRNGVNDVSFLLELKELTFLNLRNNNIIDVSFLEGLNHLTHIDLEGNPIENPPPEIVEQGLGAIRNYFRSLKDSAWKKLNEVKVLLVGTGGTGKTSLVKQLLDEPFNENESKTHGINIMTMSFHIELPNNIHSSEPTTIQAHLWDFGGQEIMHASHLFFLSKRSLYILVLDGRKDHKVEYWLKHIKSFGGNSPVLIVINKIDENPAFDLDRNTLMQKYKNIAGFYRTSCKAGTGIHEFKKVLEQTIPRTELLQTPVAISWLKVKEKLENATTQCNYINHQEFTAVCQNENITDESSRTTLIRFLNELGVVLHFHQLELKDFHVLNPRWVTEAVYKIINSSYIAENKGILEKEKVDYVLNKEKIKTLEYDQKLPGIQYTTPEQCYIVSLMEKFELCYTLANDQILIPDLLGQQTPDLKLDDWNALKFIFQYDFLPRSVMPRLIINLHPDIKDECRWRTGMVLENTDYHTEALVNADEVDKAIFIQINGERKREYLSIIRHTLNEINNSFEHLQYKELIPLPIPGHIIKKYNDPKEVPKKYQKTVPYSFLLGYEGSGRDEYFDGDTGLSYSVSQLLDSVVRPEERKKEGREEGSRIYIIQNTNFHTEASSIVRQMDVKEKESPASDQKLAKIQRLSKKIEQLKLDFQKEENLKELCDGEAEKKARRLTWRFAVLNIFILIAWTVLIFLFGWEIIEKWTYLAALLALVIHAVILALTGKAYNSQEAKARRLDKEKKMQYTKHRFSMDEYGHLKTELEDSQRLHHKLLE